MGKVTKLNLETAPVGDRSRLHLRDIQDDNPEPRGSVGAELRAGRLARGEDLSEVASRLRIRREQLEAIEGSDYSRLPGRTYSIGFVRAYSDYLGLDAKEMVARFKAEAEAGEVSAPAGELVFPEADDESKMPRGTMVVIAIAVLAALYGIWDLTVSADRMVEERSQAAAPSSVPATRITPPETNEVPAARDTATADNTASTLPTVNVPGTGEAPAPEAGAAAVIAEPAAPATPADEVAETDVEASEAPAEPAAEAGTETASAEPVQPSASEEGDQVSPLETGADNAWEGFVYGQQNHDSRIIIRARVQTWVRVEDGAGNVLISRTLRAGESYRAPDREGMILATRNAGALELVVDGSVVGRAGAPGEVLTDRALDPAALSGQ